MLKLHHMTCMFVFVVYVQPTYGAVIKVGAAINYYIINIDPVNFQSLYQCLADGLSESCLLHLKDLNDKQYNVKKVTRENKKIKFQPQFTCSFTLYSYGPGKDKVECTRSSLDITPQMTNYCSPYDFIIKWEHTGEYFTDNSLVNCTTDLTTFTYRSTSLSTTATTTSGSVMTSPSSVESTQFTPIFTTVNTSSETQSAKNQTLQNTSVINYVTNGSIQTRSNVVPIIIGVVVIVALIAAALITYTVFRISRKKYTNRNSDMKSITSPDSLHVPSQEENMYTNTDSGMYYVNSESDRGMSGNNSTMNGINQSNQCMSGNNSTIDGINQSNEGMSDYYSSVDAINQGSSITTVNSAGILSSSATNQTKCTHETNTDRIELTDITSSEHVYSRLNEQTKVCNAVYGDLLL